MARGRSSRWNWCLSPAQSLLHLAVHDGVEGLQSRLRHPVRGLHQLQEEAGHLAAVEAGEVHAPLDRAPDAPPQDGEILYDPDRITPQLVLVLCDSFDQRPDGTPPAEGLYGLGALQELGEDQDQLLHPRGQSGIGTILNVPAASLPPEGQDGGQVLAKTVGYARRALHALKYNPAQIQEP
jgi:hypothetical protein